MGILAQTNWLSRDRIYGWKSYRRDVGKVQISMNADSWFYLWDSKGLVRNLHFVFRIKGSYLWGTKWRPTLKPRGVSRWTPFNWLGSWPFDILGLGIASQPHWHRWRWKILGSLLDLWPNVWVSRFWCVSTYDSPWHEDHNYFNCVKLDMGNSSGICS